MALLRMTMPSLWSAVIAACRLWDVSILVLSSWGVRWMVVMSSWTVVVAILWSSLILVVYVSFNVCDP